MAEKSLADDDAETPAEDGRVRLLVEVYRRARVGGAAAEKENAAFGTPVQREAADAKRLSDAQERLKVWQQGWTRSVSG